MSGVGLDASWIWGLNLAAQSNLLFGRDIGFTYGPLGFLNQPIIPLTPAAPFVTYVMGMYAAWLLVLYRIRDHRVFALFAAFVYVSLAIWLWDMYEVLMIGLAVCAIIGRRSRLPVVILAFMTGAAPLLRLHQLVAGVALLAFALWWQRDSRRELWWRSAPLVAIASFTVLWKASGQDFAYLAPWLRSSFEIVNGYTEAMALPGPMWQVATGIVSLAVAVGLALWIAPATVVPVAVVGFLLFKHAFVRQDAHAAPFHFKMAALALLLWAPAIGLARKEAAAKTFAILMLVLGLFISVPIFPYIQENLQDRLTLRYPRHFIPGYLDFETFVAGRAEGRKQEMLPSILDNNAKLAIGNATVDVLPNQIDVIGANGLRWSPRPVFQSYSAYTPYLDAWNAAHYRNDTKAPGKLLVHWQFIDGRHMLLDDPLTWREALLRYRYQQDVSIGADPKWGLLLERKPVPDQFQPVTSQTAEVPWDQWIDVPLRGDREHELVTMSVHVESTWTGKAIRQVLRGTAMFFEVRYEDGMQAVFRAVRANLASGAIVTPLPRYLEEVRPLFNGEWKRVPDIVKIRFQTNSPQRFEPVLHVRFEKLRRIVPGGLGN
ncbi:membrane protein [Bryobacterales bacterium F-183]|nr:membrane protein [Bryobacterales bacterium F-183]